MQLPTLAQALKVIDRKGMVLLYPVPNKPEIPSLWGEFFPRKKMNWNWSSDADGRIAYLWHMRREISESGKVVYTKWLQNRATFISKPLFVALSSKIAKLDDPTAGLLAEAQTLYDVLSGDSPLATKKLRAYSDLEGKNFESVFTRSMKQLWDRMLIVGWGESDEGGFPSLEVGATKLLFEDLWDEAKIVGPEAAAATIAKYLDQKSAFYKTYERKLLKVSPGGVVS